MVAALTLVIALVALAVAPAAEAGGPFMMVGAADDVVVKENAADAATEVERAQQAGLDTLRLTAQWTRGQTVLESRAAAALGKAVAAAKAGNVRVVLSLYPYGSSQTPQTPTSRADFAGWAGDVVTRFPYVHDFVVGNEPNLNRFWLPQYGPERRERGRSRLCDAARADLRRDQGDPAPLDDLRRRARPPRQRPRRHRTRHPLADAVHPRHGRGVPRQRPREADHERLCLPSLRGCVERAAGRGSPGLDLDRDRRLPEARLAARPSLRRHRPDAARRCRSSTTSSASRSQIPAIKETLYTGTEPATVHPVDEATQAAFYKQALQLTFCQPTVIGLLLFHYVDERARAGWQSGLYYLDGTPKTSLTPVRDAIDATRRGVVARCPALQLTPKLTVSTTVKPRLRVTLASKLDVHYTLRLQRIDGKAPKLVLKGTLVGRTKKVVPVNANLVRGRYHWIAHTAAAKNAGAARVSTSRTFTIR